MPCCGSTEPRAPVAMISRLSILVRTTALYLMLASSAQADIIWHWQDDFSGREKARLKVWITRTVAAVETLVGPYPFDVHIHFYNMPGRGEPVPWANTRRGRVQGVNFYVDPSSSLQSFLEDWTAPHELSHLLIPSVGDRYGWFAEGFASYMQYQVMMELGVLNQKQVADNYQRHVTRAYENYPFHRLPFDRAAGELRRRRAYPTLYWGGAVYFLQADFKLRQQNSSLTELLAHYVACCRTQPKRLADLVEKLDGLSDSDIFSSQLRAMKKQRGFPAFSAVLPLS